MKHPSLLLFLAIAAAHCAWGADPGAAAPNDSIHRGVTKSPDVAVPKVEKAEGPDGRTVAEVNANRTALKGKPVAIRATVVKFTGGVMGKNWIHLRDGSGTAADNSNDIVLTSQAEFKVGDIVVVRGIVRTDVDLASGYFYKVIVEDASVQKRSS